MSSPNTYTVGKHYLFVQTVNKLNVIVGRTRDLFIAKDEYRPWMNPIAEIKLLEVTCDYVANDGRATFKNYLGHLWSTPSPMAEVTPDSHGALAVSLLPMGYDDAKESTLAYSYPYVPLDVMTSHLEMLIQEGSSHGEVFIEGTQLHLDRLNKLAATYRQRTVERDARNAAVLIPIIQWPRDTVSLAA